MQQSDGLLKPKKANEAGPQNPEDAPQSLEAALKAKREKLAKDRDGIQSEPETEV